MHDNEHPGGVDKEGNYKEETLYMKCKSGLREWISKEDADKCCNGYDRVMVLYPIAGEVDRFCGWYGYKWVKDRYGK